MADRYVNPAVGSSGAGTSWATAYKTLLEATAAATAGEKIYFANGTADVPGTGVTWILAAGVQVFSTSDTTNNPPLTYAAGASVVSATAGADFALRGVGAVFGVTFTPGPGATSTIDLATADNDNLYLEDCTLNVQSTTSSDISIGGAATQVNASVTTRRCSFIFGATGSGIVIGCNWKSVSDAFASTGTVPTVLFSSNSRGATDVDILGADLTNINTTLLAGNMISAQIVRISGSAIHASVTPLGTTVSAGSSEIYLIGCHYENAGLQGWMFYHENHLGSTTISTAIYCNDGLTYDGTNRCSWVVDGKAASNASQPYESPWVSVYNSDISTAITPYLEVVRSGSATAYTDAQIWSAWLSKATANSAKRTLYNDRALPLASSANQTASSKTGADWTGESGTSWFGKLGTAASFTPAEVGDLMARVVVAGDHTVYVDPQIRT